MNELLTAHIRSHLGRLMTSAVWVAVLLHLLSAESMRGQSDFEQRVDPLLATYCHSCHNDRLQEGGLNLSQLSGEGEDASELATWLHVRDRLLAGDMPPLTAPRPLPKDASALIQAWIEKLLQQRIDAVAVDPGSVTMRRLSSEEYLTTVRDVTGVEAADIVAGFPADDLGYGFDNIGDALSISRLHFEKYADAAELIAERALSLEDPENPSVRVFDTDGMETTIEGGAGRAGRLYRNGTCSQLVKLPRDGKYKLRVEAFGTQAGPSLPKLVLGVDGKSLGSFKVKEERGEVGKFELTGDLEAGTRRIEMSFVNDFYNPKAKDRSRRDRNLIVLRLEVVGPVDRKKPTQVERLLKETDPGPRAGKRRALKFLRRLATLAWRRPVSAAEAARLNKLVTTTQAGAEKSFSEALRVGVAAILVSPHFLFRLEAFPRPVKPGKIRRLSPYMIAQRLSYFMWGAPPDKQLMERAKSKKLSTSAEIRAAAERLLDHPKAEALGTRFSAQWLELSNLLESHPDPDLFPRWSTELATDLRHEGEQFFLKVLRDRRPLHELLDAPFAMVNQRLASHYGIEGVAGDELRAISLPASRRAGLLRLAAVHVVTSNPSRTSPVKRGKWVLENLLGNPPPPPPPGADSLEGDGQEGDGLSLRQRLELHRKRPQCASCHARMDALGFALENFDGIGRWRESSNGHPVDSRATLPDGREIHNADDLARAIKDDPAFVRCLSTKFFIYAVGRNVTSDDEVAIERLVRSVSTETSLRELILRIVSLEAFSSVSGGGK